jgi:hypothetical protein
MRNEIFNGFPILISNTVIESEKEDFYISYNAYDRMTYGSDTTALVYGEMQHFLILNGDHRKGYAKIIDKGYKACTEYFKENIHRKNKYSENINEDLFNEKK